MNECHNMPVNAVQGFLFIEHNGSNRLAAGTADEPRKVDKGSVETLGGGASRFARYVSFRGGRDQKVPRKGILLLSHQGDDDYYS